jgi:hypothetical protein
MDVITKEIIKSNTLQQLRRWAASPKSLTLDFGDYEGAYYTVQTVEGEAISQLIAGYIDILLKRKRDAGRIEKEDDTVVAAEEFVAPITATTVETTTTSVGQASFQSGQAMEGVMSGQMAMSSVGGPQQATFGPKGSQTDKQGVGGAGKAIVDIDTAMDALNGVPLSFLLVLCSLAHYFSEMIDDLEEGVPWARVQSELTPEQWKQKIQDAMVNCSANVGELIQKARQGERQALNPLSRGIFANVMDMIQAARMAGDEGDPDEM